MTDIAHGDVEVLRALLRRRHQHSKPCHRIDGERIALVVEGGGMRGAYSGGMVHALEQLGLRNGFDIVYGTSAGAFTASSFLTRQAAGAAHIFDEDLASREFIDYRRPPTGRGPLLSLDYLMEHVLVETKPMDWDALLSTDIPLWVVATALPELEAVALGGYTDLASWKLALRASACLPVLAGPPVKLDGREWLDGSVTEPLAVRRALDDGATLVLALLSRTLRELPDYEEEGGPLWSTLLENMNPGLWRTIADRPRRYAELTKLFTANSRVLGLRPAPSVGVRALTTDPDRLRAASAAGSAAILDAVAEANRDVAATAGANCRCRREQAPSTHTADVDSPRNTSCS